MGSDLEHHVFQEWLDRAADDGLTASEKSALQDHLSTCADCRAEGDRLARLHKMLKETRIPVSSGFSTKVLEALPAARWEIRQRRSWRLPAAVLGVLAAASAGFVAIATPAGGADASLLRALWLVAELMAAGAVAGAGLLGASWRGIGLMVQSLLAGSLPAMLFFAAAVLGLNLLLFRLIRGPAGLAAARSRGQSDSGDQ